MATVMTCPSHTKCVFDLTEMRHVAYWAAKVIRDVRGDAIVASGHSGLVLAGAVGLLAYVPVFAVRKAGEEKACIDGGYATSGVKHDGPAKRWVWLDDFFASGGTFARSAQRVFGAGLVKNPAPVAVLSYRERGKTLVDGDVIDRLRRELPQISMNIRIPEYGYLPED